MAQIVTNQFNVSTVEKGDNAIYLDLSNDNDSILYIDGAAKNSCVTTITLYDGGADVTSQAVISHTATGCSVTKSGRTFTVTAITGDNVKGSVTINAAYNGQTYTNTFTVTKLVDKDRYEMICTPNAVTVNTTTGTKSASSIKVEIYKTPYTTGIRAKLNTLDGGHSLKYYVNNGVSPTAISYSGGSGSFNVDANNSSYRVVLASGDVEIDSETIPINKSENGVDGVDGKDGKDGKDGNGIVSITNTFALSAQGTTASETTAPTIVGSWSTTQPTPTDTYPYLWRREVTVYTDTSKNTTKYFLVAGKGKNGDNGRTGRWYYFDGEFDGTAEHYQMDKTQAPYVKYNSKFWMLDFQGEEPTSFPKKASQTPSSSSTEWTEMQSENKYYIAQAFFGPNAYLGSFIINNDWMISQFGVIYDTSGGAHNINSDTASWNGYNKGNAYTLFNASYPNSSRPGYNNFCPYFAVDGKTGRSYMNEAFIKGTINATSGVISGNVDIGTTGNKMQIYADENRATGYYSGIKGISNNNNVFDLGFNTQNGYTNIFMEMIGTMPFAGREMICVVRPYEIVFQDHTGSTWAQIGYSYDTRSGKMYFRLSASPSIWPREGIDDISALPDGTVYIRDDACLGVKLS